MRCALISIGDELLIGQVVNTNAAWLGEQLNRLGISVSKILAISDTSEAIISSLEESKKETELIIITGGLGPTKDDLTKHTLAAYFNSPLVFQPEVYRTIETLFQQRGSRVSEINRKQAEVPECCTVLPNQDGTAPGMWFREGDNIIISLPGVPYEMQGIFTNAIIPRLREIDGGNIILQKNVLTIGLGESLLAERIAEWENQLPVDMSLAYLPQPGMVRLRLTLKGTQESLLSARLQQQLDQLKVLIEPYIFGYDEDRIESVVGDLLLGANKTLSIAESCTGGYISHLITGIAGSSRYFKGSIIAYDNAVKEHLLNLPPSILINHGAVSAATVEIMAQNVRELLCTDYGLAVSGIAGPGGGTEEKPVGTIWIAVANKETVHSELFLLGNHRGRNIRKAGIFALNMLRKKILASTKRDH